MKKRWFSLILLSTLLGPLTAQENPTQPGSNFATAPAPTANTVIDAPMTTIPNNGTLIKGDINFNVNIQATNAAPGATFLQAPPPELLHQSAIEPDKGVISRIYQDNLFHYSWIDFGDSPGLRIHRLEITNAWADIRAANFFTRPVEVPEHRFNAGLSFGVQWWKEQFLEQSTPVNFQLPPVLYDLYADFGWRTAIAPNWMIDLAISPGLSTDFRITPPDGFRLKGHAMTMVDMLANLRGVLGVTYLNRNSVKILPVAGFSWQATEMTRVEAIFPQPRIVHTLGCWQGTSWEASIGGEFGGGGWAFKNQGNDRETIDYRDLRLLAGISTNGKRGQATLQAGYVFSRELQYGMNHDFDYAPGNAWMIRLSWDY